MNKTSTIGNLTVKINPMAIIMGILITATIFFLVPSNTHGIAFAQSSFNVGCTDKVIVTISDFPKQTAVASSVVTLSNTSSDGYEGQADINIPGIGNGSVIVNYHVDSDTPSASVYSVIVGNLPGEHPSAQSVFFDIGDVCGAAGSFPISIDIPEIGSGSIMMAKTD